SMHTIGYRADGIFGEHAAGDFAVAHGDSVDVSGKAESEVGHVKGVPVPGVSFVEKFDALGGEDLLGKCAGKLVVSGGHRSMGGEDAHAADAVDVELFDATGKALVETTFEQAEGEQRGVTLVHVIGLNLVVAHLLQDAQAS